MKRKPANKRTTVVKAKPDGLAPLIGEVRTLVQATRRGIASVVDTLQVLTNFEIGRCIVEHEQRGEKRAGYGQEMLKALSTRLTEEFGRGFSVTNLQLIRRFFIENKSRIQQKASVKLASREISQIPSAISAPVEIWQKPSAKSGNPFTLSWSHYVELLTVKDPAERSFYEIEATDSGWSLPDQRINVGV
jgi:hypothetical protein